ncbi:MAG TPA: hypothetical protein IGS53_07165, partial [Leptolyngbyaceae cyanobacterium M33_DOE_097]|nr:hypothetical protein [Leptolyngbyaceae cyanobacterium M33_DOE_097]
FKFFSSYRVCLTLNLPWPPSDSKKIPLGANSPSSAAFHLLSSVSQPGYCGLRLSSIQIPEQCALLGVLRQERIIPVSENPSVDVGDIVLAIAFHPMMAPALKVALKRSHPVTIC